MLSTWLAVLLLATAAEAVEPPLRGRLCIGDACSETTSARIAVEPADRERRFFWLSDDAKTAYAGVIAPKAQSVVLDPNAFSGLDTSVDPLDVKISLGVGSEPQWKFELDREEAKRLRRLYLPRGVYHLTADAEHHRTHSAIVIASGKPAKLDIRLAPLPLARGVVVDADDRPVSAATVSFADARLCTTTNEEGAFTCELPERIPSVLVVSGSGYAPREVPLTRPSLLQKDVDLGRVQLSEGWLVTLRIVRPEQTSARVSLLFSNPRNARSRVTVSLDEDEEAVRFNAAPGKYFALVEGSGPLERLSVPLEVKDADVEREIRVEPFQLIGSVHFGDAPLAEGTVEIGPRDRPWREPIPVTNGVFSATMWQDGELNGWVHGPELAEGELFHSPKLGADPSRWDIRIEKRIIVGTVLDAATGAPVTNLGFQVEADSGTTQSYFPARVQPDGSYRILAHMPGTYKLQVDSPRHLPYQAELRIAAEDRTRTHDIALESGVLQPIDVTTPDGAPLGLTMVVEDVQSTPRADERGHYILRGLPGEKRVLYLVPPLGSFAIARVLLPRTSADARLLQVVVPPPAGALRVRTVDRGGTAAAARLLIRYNGELVPRAILNLIARGGTDRTGETLLRRLPAGTYEIWALASDEDERQLVASNKTSRKPIRVGLSGGEQAVTVVVGHGERNGRE